ncbi:MAG: flagellar hook-basal body complex protein FliE [Phycisphaeraceae bacterium]|nr:MAG: flagellar hook-basal body complex protein FliE [Phycisphaeraceae bacterium]
MSDPLGLIGKAGGLGPIQPPGAGRPPAGGAPVDPNAPTFKDVLMGELKQVNQLQQDATRAIEDLQTGRRDDLEGVLIATQQADNAFRMLLQVRNKMMDAYDEIKQIRV